jgi:hypothetical protein
MQKMNDSPEFRRECEARHVMKMPYEQRRDFYAGVLRERKQKGLDELKEEIRRQYKLQNELAIER